MQVYYRLICIAIEIVNRKISINFAIIMPCMSQIFISFYVVHNKLSVNCILATFAKTA